MDPARVQRLPNGQPAPRLAAGVRRGHKPGLRRLHRAVPQLLAQGDQRLTPMLKEVIAESAARLKLVAQCLAEYDRRIARLGKQDQRCQRLLKVEGIGPLSATALVAAIGNGHEFKNGRHFSAYLGLVPGHRNTGAKTVMRGITKRGNRYLRSLLIHGGRAAVYAARRHTDPRSRWLNRLRETSCHNVAAVALANKNARVAWAMLRFEHHPISRARKHWQSVSGQRFLNKRASHPRRRQNGWRP